jgi:hypothetical protein
VKTCTATGVARNRDLICPLKTMWPHVWPHRVDAISVEKVMSAASEAEIGALFSTMARRKQEGHIRSVLNNLNQFALPQISPQQTDLPTNEPRSGHPRQWTCDSTGSKTEWSRHNFELICYKESTSMLITSPNIHPPSRHQRIRPIYLHTGDFSTASHTQL